MNKRQISDKDLAKVKMAYTDDEDESSQYSASKKPTDPKSKTPVLDSFSRDLTKLAEEGKIDPIVDRKSISNSF